MKWKKIFSMFALLLTLMAPTGCGKKFVDYAAETRIHTQDWKTSDFWETGCGQATLKRNVDGDTAHFTAGSTQRFLQGRFNGIDTPESTGVIEKWGKKAAHFTADILNKAKTIILETEREDGLKKPENDTNNRYMVWVWTSERPIEEEDGSQLQLLNLRVVQEGFSPAKGAIGSVYQDAFLNADAQAQKFKMHIWSKDVDDEFYVGAATISNLKDIFSEPDEHVGEKVYVEGVVTRTMGTNAYIQESFENDETGAIENYGCYIFTQYKQYDILKRGNRIGAVGIVAEHFGSYQLVDVKYTPGFHGEDDMVLLEENVEIDPVEMTVPEANEGKGMGTLIRVNGLVATGGYGGLDEKDANGNPNESNSMTIYMKNSSNQSFNVRIDKATFIRDLDRNQIRTYRYFVDWCKANPNGCFDIVGILGRYESEETGRTEIQLMLVATSDLIYHS